MSSGKTNRKHNRHKLRSPAATRYRNELRWLKNKARKLTKHCLKYVNDRQAEKCLEKL